MLYVLTLRILELYRKIKGGVKGIYAKIRNLPPISKFHLPYEQALRSSDNHLNQAVLISFNRRVIVYYTWGSVYPLLYSARKNVFACASVN